MGKVLLEGMEFFGYHGMYPEERVLGNRFLVNLELHTDFEDAMLTDRLEGTVDYAQLYQLVKVRIIQDIRAAFPQVSQIRITLKKHQPAIGGLMDFSGVTISYPEDFS